MILEENKRYRLETGNETAPLVLENEMFYDSKNELSFYINGVCANSHNKDIIAEVHESVELPIEYGVTMERIIPKEEQDEIDRMNMRNEVPIEEVADVPFMSKEEQAEIGVAEESIEMIMEKYPVAEVPISKFSEMQLKTMPGISENHEVAFNKETGKIVIDLTPTNEYPEINCIYKHYKGGHYRVLTLADHTETGELLVITQSVEFGTVRARPLTVWHSPIVPAQGSIKRFTLTQ